MSTKHPNPGVVTKKPAQKVPRSKYWQMGYDAAVAHYDRWLVNVLKQRFAATLHYPNMDKETKRIVEAMLVEKKVVKGVCKACGPYLSDYCPLFGDHK